MKDKHVSNIVLTLEHDMAQFISRVCQKRSTNHRTKQAGALLLKRHNDLSELLIQRGQQKKLEPKTVMDKLKGKI